MELFKTIRRPLGQLRQVLGGHETAQLREELAAANEREKALRQTIESLTSQHHSVAEQHRHMMKQHAHAVEQYAHAAEQLRLSQAESGPSETEAERGPSIFISTLPKTGSIYLLNTLSRGLQYRPFNVSLGYFPHDLLDWPRLQAASRGGMISQTHIDASPANLQILELVQPKVQVHLRDPRQAMLSMTHHLRRLWEDSADLATMLCVQPRPQREFFDRPLEGQIDWMIEHYLPHSSQWIDDWLQVIDSGATGLSVLLTTFEELIQNEAAFLERSISFFGISSQAFVVPKVEKSMAVHFRQGKPDEWKQIFTAEQRRRARQFVRPEWADRFGWVS